MIENVSRLTMGRGVGEPILVCVETCILVDVTEPDRIDLGDLIAQEFDLPESRTLVTAERGDGRIDLGQSSARNTQIGGVDTAELIEGGALNRC